MPAANIAALPARLPQMDQPGCTDYQQAVSLCLMLRMRCVQISPGQVVATGGVGASLPATVVHAGASRRCRARAAWAILVGAAGAGYFSQVEQVLLHPWSSSSSSGEAAARTPADETPIVFPAYIPPKQGHAPLPMPYYQRPAAGTCSAGHRQACNLHEVRAGQWQQSGKLPRHRRPSKTQPVPLPARTGWYIDQGVSNQACQQQRLWLQQ